MERFAFLDIMNLEEEPVAWYLHSTCPSMSKSFIPFVFILLWIVPVGWVGLMRSNYPLYPAWIAPLFRVSGVFESAPDQWRIFFIEVQDKKSGNWNNVDEKSLFASTPLGNRTRFQPLMNDLITRPKARTFELLSWIAAHLSKVGYDINSIKSVRIVECHIPSKYFLSDFSSTELQVEKTGLPLTTVETLQLSGLDEH